MSRFIPLPPRASSGVVPSLPAQAAPSLPSSVVPLSLPPKPVQPPSLESKADLPIDTVIDLDTWLRDKAAKTGLGTASAVELLNGLVDKNTIILARDLNVIVKTIHQYVQLLVTGRAEPIDVLISEEEEQERKGTIAKLEIRVQSTLAMISADLSVMFYGSTKQVEQLDSLLKEDELLDNYINY